MKQIGGHKSCFPLIKIADRHQSILISLKISLCFRILQKGYRTFNKTTHHIFQNIMVFKKLSINGKSYGDYVDEAENPIEITEVNIFLY